MKVQPLFETWNESNFIVEAAGDNKEKNYFIEGITLQGEKKNANNRIYPIPVLNEAVGNHTSKFPLDKGRACGELGHPDTNYHIINYKNTSHKFVMVEKQGNDYFTKALILNTDSGKIAKNLIDGGVSLGISSRGFGPTKLVEGTDIVQKLHLVSLGDLEHNNSAPDAMLTAIMERKEWVFENGVLIEKDLEEKIDDYNNIITNASKSQLEEAILFVVKDYFKQILK